MQEKKAGLLHSGLKMFEMSVILKFQTARDKLCIMALLNTRWHSLIMTKNYAWTELPVLGDSWWRNKESFLQFLLALQNFKYVTLPVLEIEMLHPKVLALFSDLVAIRHTQIDYSEQAQVLLSKAKPLLAKIHSIRSFEYHTELFSHTTHLVKLHFNLSFPALNYYYFWNANGSEKNLSIAIPSLKELTLVLESRRSIELNLEDSEQLETLQIERDTHPTVKVILILTNPKLKKIALSGKVEVKNLKDVLMQYQNLEQFAWQGLSAPLAHSYLQFAPKSLKQLTVSKILHSNFPFLSSFQSLCLTAQFLTEVAIQDLPSLTHFQILFVQAKVTLSNLKSLRSITFSESFVQFEGGIGPSTSLELLPQVFFPLSSLLPLKHALTRLRIDSVSESPEYVIEHFPLNEALSLSLHLSAPGLLSSLPSKMSRLTKLSLSCTNQYQMKQTLGFPALRSLHIYPGSSSEGLNSFLVCKECVSLEKIEVFGNCRLQVHAALEHMLVSGCEECEIVLNAPVRLLEIRGQEEVALSGGFQIGGFEVDSLVLSRVEGKPVLQLKELRKLQVKNFYDEELVKSIMEGARAVKFVKLEQIENVDQIEIPKWRLEAVDSSETGYGVEVKCAEGVKEKKRN